MEEKEEYDEIVEKVVKRLIGNDLYVKLEECKWKVKEVGFLGIVIGPGEIKMEKEKIKGVLDWLAPKGVKSIQKFLGPVNYYQWFIQDFACIAWPLHNIVKNH